MSEVREVESRESNGGGLLTEDQAAQYLATSPRHLRTLRASRRIPYVKVGRRVRFRRSDLDAFAASNLVEAAVR